MFLHLSVSHSVHRGEYLGRYPPPGRYTSPLAGTSPGRYTPLSRYTPRQVHPLGRYTPQACTPQVGTAPPNQVHHPSTGRYTPGKVHPLVGKPPHRQGYSQQAGGTHPTGMHSCLIIVLFWAFNSQNQLKFVVCLLNYSMELFLNKADFSLKSVNSANLKITEA